jgi:DNA-directed RNA polymerase specialized sigma24 family protein
MMTKVEKIRKAAPGLPEADVTRYARMTVAEVDSLCRILRRTRRDALQAEAAKRRQRRLDNRRHGNYDEFQLTERNLRVVGKQGERAGDGNLDALAALGATARFVDEQIAQAVAKCRARGYTDPEIAEMLGVTRQALGQRYGRKKNIGLA